LPPTVTFVVGTKDVASFAPGIHTRPYGTRPPKICRPRTRGLEYSMVIDLPLANWHMAVAGGLSCARAPWVTTGANRTTSPIANAVLCDSMRSLLECSLVLSRKCGPHCSHSSRPD